MTAPVFLADPATLLPPDAMTAAEAGTTVILTGSEARHAVAVRRLRSGERVDLVDGEGTRLICEVAHADRDRLTARVLERVEEQTDPVHLVLVQALAKGGRDEQAVETATEVGVARIVPWQAQRSVAVWKGAKLAKGRQRWQATAREAAKQARRAVVPRVAEPMGTATLADWVRQVTGEGGVVVILHEEATAPIGEVCLPAPELDAPVLAVVVGPEGGIGQEETGQLEAAGARTVRLGPHVMRTASAGPVALAVLAQRAGLWG